MHHKSMGGIGMNYENRLNAAIDYAIDSHYDIWNRQNKVWSEIKAHKYICLFGTGKFYRDLVGHIYTDRFEYVGDNDPKKIGTYIDGRKCLSPIEIEQMKDDIAVIIMVKNYDAVHRQLSEMGIHCYTIGECVLNTYDRHYDDSWFMKKRSEIISTIQLFSDELSKEIYVECICNRVAPQLASKKFYELQQPGEYFASDVFEINDSHQEFLVDCGAYIGDSIDDFVRVTNGNYGAVYAFELDEKIFNILKERTQGYQNIEYYNYGVSDEYSEFEYNYIQGTKSRRAKVDAIDNILTGKRVTYIKMDVETYELKALEGAKTIITTQQPKLCISAYHYLSDLWEVPKKIKNLVPDYKLYLRHHSPCVWDTDCYACR